MDDGAQMLIVIPVHCTGRLAIDVMWYRRHSPRGVTVLRHQPNPDAITLQM